MDHISGSSLPADIGDIQGTLENSPLLVPDAVRGNALQLDGFNQTVNLGNQRHRCLGEVFFYFCMSIKDPTIASNNAICHDRAFMSFINFIWVCWFFRNVPWYMYTHCYSISVTKKAEKKLIKFLDCLNVVRDVLGFINGSYPSQYFLHYPTYIDKHKRR